MSLVEGDAMYAGSALLALPFVHPGLAALAGAAGLIPILIHLINRRRYVRVQWAAMPFLLAANRRSVSRLFLEQWVLLFVRVAIVVLLGLALARPFMRSGNFLSLGASRTHRLLIIDNSLSVNARGTDGQSRFEEGISCAERLLSSFPEHDPISLITLAEPAEAVIGQPGYDRRLVRERLAGVKPTQRSADVLGAIEVVSSILSDTRRSPDRRAVYLLSDLPQSIWSTPVAEREPPTPAVISLRQLADALSDPASDLTVVQTASGALGNAGIAGLTSQHTLIGVDLPVRIEAVVTNFGPTSLRDGAVEFRQEGRIIRRQPLALIEPGESQHVSITTAFSTPGTHAVEARLFLPIPDALVEDDVRYLSVDVREKTAVLLVDGRPGATRLGGETGFLAAALAPSFQTGISDPVDISAARMSRLGLIEPRTITASELDGEVLPEYGVIALCNVGQLASQQWDRLEQFVSAGGGLLITGGDLVSVEMYNQRGYADGEGLLPGKFIRVRARRERAETELSFRYEQFIHPITVEFTEEPNSGLFLARVLRSVPFEPDSSRADVVLRYSNGEPALITSTFGAGRVCVYTTSASMDWNNLPAKGDYVSLMLNTMAYLSPRQGDHRNLRVGQHLSERVSAAQSSMAARVAAEGGMTVEPSLVPSDDGLAVEYGPLDRAGFYTLSIGPDVRHFAANVDGGESDIRVVDGQTFAESLDRSCRFIAAKNIGETYASASAVTGEFSTFAVYLVIALLFVEMLMAMRFGSQRG